MNLAEEAERESYLLVEVLQIKSVLCVLEMEGQWMDREQSLLVESAVPGQ